MAGRCIRAGPALKTRHALLPLPPQLPSSLAHPAHQSFAGPAPPAHRRTRGRVTASQVRRARARRARATRAQQGRRAQWARRAPGWPSGSRRGTRASARARCAGSVGEGEGSREMRKQRVWWLQLARRPRPALLPSHRAGAHLAQAEGRSRGEASVDVQQVLWGQAVPACGRGGRRVQRGPVSDGDDAGSSSRQRSSPPSTPRVRRAHLWATPYRLSPDVTVWLRHISCGRIVWRRGARTSSGWPASMHACPPTGAAPAGSSLCTPGQPGCRGRRRSRAAGAAAGRR